MIQLLFTFSIGWGMFYKKPRAICLLGKAGWKTDPLLFDPFSGPQERSTKWTDFHVEFQNNNSEKDKLRTEFKFPGKDHFLYHTNARINKRGI